MSNPTIVKSHDIKLDAEYSQWIIDIKQRFRNTQIKAAVKVNSEQLLFNWQLGRDLVNMKAEEKWGSGIVEQISMDLQNEFPEAKGFSTRNLWYMKQWYSFFSDEKEIQKLHQLGAEIESNIPTIKLHQLGAEIPNSKLHQDGGEMIFPTVLGYVPWRHHVEITTKCKSVDEAIFYVKRTIEEGLSRKALLDYMEADLYNHAGKAVSNFKETLPLANGKLVQEIVKDTYDLSYISLPSGYNEERLEDAIEQNITRFLLELGTGFAFVGRQKEIIVSGKTRKIDLLFYHIRLRCYVVVDLKVVPFEPEFAGKLNFYVNAVNELLRTPDENPTIGLLICRNKDQAEVKWAFQGIENPLGVATYSNIQIEEIKEQLPSADEIKTRIELAEKEFYEKNNV